MASVSTIPRIVVPHTQNFHKVSRLTPFYVHGSWVIKAAPQSQKYGVPTKNLGDQPRFLQMGFVKGSRNQRFLARSSSFSAPISSKGLQKVNFDLDLPFPFTSLDTNMAKDLQNHLFNSVFSGPCCPLVASGG